jgi:LysR family glycine cleavage system transcriptional activator
VKRLPSLNALKAFAVAAQEGSFTLAGEVLHVTQGAISRQVKQLESEMGVPLFVRVHQRVELTPAGRELSLALNRLFDEMEAAVTQAIDKSPGQARRQTLAVNVPPTFATRWLAPRLSDFRSRFPHIDLSITTDNIQSLRDARSVDCLVVFGQEAWPQVTCMPVMVERSILVSSPKLWVDGKPPSIQKSTLLHILDGDQRLPVWEHWIAVHGPAALDVRPGLNFSTLDQAINAAITGAGLVVVDAAMIVRELKSGELLRHNALETRGPNGYWFIVSPGRPSMEAAVAQFRDWLMQQVQLAVDTGQTMPG